MPSRQPFIPALTGLLCLVVLVIGGGCDFLANLLPNDTNRIRIPSGPEAVTNEHFNRLHYSWMYRNTVDAYQRAVSTPRAYDQQAVAFLDRISMIESHVDDNPDWQALMQQGSELLAAGCNSPLVSLWYGVALFHCARFDGAEAVLKNVRENLKDTNLPGVLGFFVARTLLEITHHRQGNLDCMCSDSFELLGASLADALINKDFFDMEVRVCYRLVQEFEDRLEYEKIWELLQTVLADSDNIDPYFLLLIKGKIAVIKAWEARGGGWSNTVTDEGWQGFRENLALAREAFTEAWKLEPQYPEAPALMITVVMAGPTGPRDTEILWFNRSVKAQMDYSIAYKKYFQALLPRWGGSFDKILEFGLICLQTKRFDTDVPMQYLYALRRIASDQKYDRWRLAFRDAEATSGLAQLFEGMLAAPNREKDRERILTQQAFTELWRGNYEHARQMLDSINKRCDVKNGFAGMNLSWSGRDWPTIDTEIALFLGSDKLVLQKAEELHLAGNDVEAKRLFSEVMDTCRHDPAKFTYLRERLALQMMDDFPPAAHNTAMHIAAGNNDAEAIHFLIDNGADLEARNQYGNTPLNVAARSKQLQAAEILLAAGADPNTLNNSNRTPLYNTCLVKNGELAKLLINKKADINQADHIGLAPLHVAVIYQLPGIVKTLIDLGAPVDIRTNQGMTPLHYAILRNDAGLIKMLLTEGADVNLKSDGDMEPLLIFANSGNVEMCRLMLEYGAKVNAEGPDKWTPLHYAAYYGNAELAKLLLQKGADPLRKLATGETPLEIARLYNRDEVAAIISEKL